jgi:uncharacterized LabA/DUF88 family protein
MPPFRRMMIFVDGENLVCRYQAMVRATYYTYAVGDDERIEGIKKMIKDLTFAVHRNSVLPNNLTPKVFKKSNRSAKAKGVDIEMTVDILSNVYRDNLDCYYRETGITFH